MSNFSEIAIKYADSGSIDAFSRLRVSQTANLFDSQLTYNLAPLMFEQVVVGAGASIAHDATNRCALMTFSSTATGGKAFMQSYEYIPYQPGKSQLAFITFNFIEAIANAKKFARLGDDNNSIEFRVNGTTLEVAILSDTTNGDDVVTQANWNLDKLDGTGVSALTLDVTKAQIFVIDLQALYVGRVRVGFDINGSVYYVHEFNHANSIAHPYIQSANLPIACGMTCTGTVSTTMSFICCSVASEGGESEARGRTFSVEGTGTAGNNTPAHILSIRPKTTFNSITNRVYFALESIEVLVTGNSPIKWELVLGQAISGTTTYLSANATYSAYEYNTLGTISGSPAIVIASGYTVASAQTKTASSIKFNQRYPITLGYAGAVRAIGTLSLNAIGISATSACRVIFNFREVR